MAYDDEKVKGRAERYTLDYGYWMARFPVTNAQFERFVKDGGYATGRYWPEAEKAGAWRDDQIQGSFDAAPGTGPYDLGTPFGLPNHPVVGIIWYEALAYTRWLTERWQHLGFIRSDQEVALPSEPEWEKAARGGLEIMQPDTEHARPRPATSGLPTLEDVSNDRLAPNEQPERRYPWGRDPDANRANYADTGIGTTSAVGVFPGGASPYGCEEMSGNCWEWTRSLWGHYPYLDSLGDLNKKREALNASRRRVVRGGGFYNNARYVRCAYRSWNTPVPHSGYLGFRVVVRPSL
jgi:formylglycine-generating enzyme required for sulfatase activity